MKKTSPSFTIMFPFLNDWGTVGSLVALAIAAVSAYTDDWEVIIVDDGSKPKDREALQLIVETINLKSKVKSQKSKLQFKIQKYQENRIRIITHKKNKGYGGALRSGFREATKDLIFYTDCDAQYDPRELRFLYKALRDDVALVNGYKIKRLDPWHRIIAGRVYHHVVRFVFGLPLRDTDCDFRLIRRSVFDKVQLFENTGTICVELVKKIDHFGFRIIEVPVHHYWRTSGRSQFFNFGRLAQTGIHLFRLWWKLMIQKEYGV